MIFSWKKIAIFLGILVATCSFVYHTHAQSADDVTSYDSSVNEGDFDFEINPENPGPYEPVTIKLSSNLVDANRYPITWTVDGAIVSSGTGKRTITVSTKGYGTPVVITMSIVLIDSTITKQLTLAPQDTTMLWEAVDSYVPPFYEGKKLPSYEALIRIASIPNFLGDKTSAGTKTAVYNWSRNKNVIPDAGGYGKDSILIQHNRIRPNEFIEVTSSDVDGTSQAMSNITIPFFDPKILFYERNSDTRLRSPFALSSLYLTKVSTIIEAVPYFFSTATNNPNALVLSWTMNNKPVSVAGDNKMALAIKTPDKPGTAVIGFTAKQPILLFQSANSDLTITFNKNPK